ncbi:RDD family protein [Pontibacter actiniarum]|uniref:RDD family protein n=1 Tax=Pontibacter actiniarum TaxID=323450 RepID=A0A1X9YN52_9BACT|nr:RDD family protein [Pontibacter actiniarum]ARS34251.1 RDD family protein [Pontibacter actiniarum]
MQTAYTLPNAPTIKRSALYGSLSIRFVSFLVDTTLLVFSYTFILYGLSSTPEQLYTWKDLSQDSFSLSEMLVAVKMLFLNPYFPIIHWAYYTLLESSQKQATIGKFTHGLKVTDLRGKRISFAQANLRYFSKLVSAVPLALGFLLMLTSRRHQMLHDYLARTLVVTD